MKAVPGIRTQRERLMAFLIFGSLIETAWTAYLGWKLPPHYEANHWDIAWVGLDAMQIAAYLACAWAAWRERALLILFTAIAGTLSLVDAWFDVTTARRGGILQSGLLAAFVEIPFALLMFWVCRRALHRVASNVLELVDVRITKIPLSRRD